MGRIDTLVNRYKRYIALPWQKNLAGAQKAIFVVYDKNDERRLRLRRPMFELATREAGYKWRECDLTRAFSQWMATIEYRDSYFESPEDLALKLDDEFVGHVADIVRSTLLHEDVDEETVVGVFGVASLFGFLRVSELMQEVEKDIRGRLVVFFPGEFENANYRLLDARDGWNYLAVPITVQEERGVYEV